MDSTVWFVIAIVVLAVLAANIEVHCRYDWSSDRAIKALLGSGEGLRNYRALKSEGNKYLLYEALLSSSDEVSRKSVAIVNSMDRFNIASTDAAILGLNKLTKAKRDLDWNRFEAKREKEVARVNEIVDGR